MEEVAEWLTFLMRGGAAYRVSPGVNTLNYLAVLFQSILAKLVDQQNDVQKITVLLNIMTIKRFFLFKKEFWCWELFWGRTDCAFMIESMNFKEDMKEI